MASGGQAGATEADRAARVGTYENARPEVQALVPATLAGCSISAARRARWVRP